MKEGSIVGPIRLYMLSLWLLFLLLFIQTLDIPLYFGPDAEFIGIGNLLLRNIVPLILIVLMVFDILTYIEIKVMMKNCADLPQQTLKVKPNDIKTIDFFTSTILPLAFTYFDSVKGYISLVIILFSLGILFIKTKRVYLNPTLLILGLKTYEITFKDEKSIVALSLNTIESGNYISKTLINDEYYYIRKKG